MENVTEEMRDSNMVWVPYDDTGSTNKSKQLINLSNPSSPILYYETNSDGKGRMKKR